MGHRTLLHVFGGSILALALAWQAGPRVVDQGALLALRGGAGGCSQLDCSDTTCGKHCSNNATGSCTLVDINNPTNCGGGAGNSCNSLSTQTCTQPN